MARLFSGFRGFAQAVREINAKYRTPRIKFTPMVKLALLGLRLYLILMVLILVYKFVTILVG